MTHSAGLHEPEDRLSPETADRHRAIASLQEELEAIDRYDQRVDATSDPHWPRCWRTTVTRRRSTPRCSWSGCAATTRSWTVTFAPTCSRARRSPRSRPRPRRRSPATPVPRRGWHLRRRQPQRRVAVNHLLRSHAPITDIAWSRLEPKAASGSCLRSAPVSWWTSPAPGLGALGHEPGPGVRHQGSRREPAGAPAPGPAAGRASGSFRDLAPRTARCRPWGHRS